ncbi:hypothetical protein EHI8A_039920 [Entamoeba histolytica HM-1:IMSS-B]|uniref:TLDc domain-containing protein n=6 Tax=Entamoeba histolytica TaxID=5759 RepID=C4M6J1_ENTH1|nr:hypothetical protein EHI_060360 [Entamoeba histolytica HM-1:IMSS]EMD47435.1 Hypothetical protein EHI5A_033400 [Entamoeba histolytica KU27]EMH77532.1 hypothetical protein EHI8A_039920 [Entamoeba histolytica HM-1:IMSS-B]EMS16762.1 hypothetical protein KM1_044370 [Entamoeba histolytica HM-3:IMSS]ENY65615.1 hypothetical protein EHI7A_082230 [Entamoeba histolytica HM-1:IMSS-A]GAT97109.1 hypothetical protein CL6EHI_060360 [Entamoeba histolytica]|eukprot:XP_653243.2 hypothetical protein EHI_060360 [Entamoeba histolytica HM-1:IMSS]
MEKLIKNDMINKVKRQLIELKEAIKKGQSQIDKEIENSIEGKPENTEVIIEQKLKGIEEMKKVIEECESFIHEANEMIQKEEFNCFVMKNKKEEISKEEELNKMKGYAQSIKRKEVHEEFEKCDEFVVNQNEDSKKEEERIMINQLQNDLIEQALTKLQEWSNKNEVHVLFDSDLNEWSECQNTELFNRPSIFLFIFDENNNVFGWYFPQGINENGIGEYQECYLQKGTEKIFEIQKIKQKDIKIGRGDCIIEMKQGNTIETQINFSSNKKTTSYCYDSLFNVKRIICIQMLCDECLDVIQDNLQQLQEWSGLYECSRLYDTLEDGENEGEMKERINGESNIFIICIDEYGNVFGCFIETEIGDSLLLNSRNHFLFAFDNTEDLSGHPRRWKMKKERLGKLILGDNDMLFSCGDDISPFGMLIIFKTSFRSSFCASLSNVYECIKDDDLNGTCFNDERRDTFKVQRVIVLKMN